MLAEFVSTWVGAKYLIASHICLRALQLQNQPQSGVNIRLQPARKRARVLGEKRAVEGEKLGNEIG